ncbi:hypothetical protein [Leptospira sp. id769339]|uniref:hypothetical protein n=1 Tax=Leptospira sp. id769339 TaxID=2864221 RepID=UPI00214C634E|nr:hypothetical protein [Leptospira sp. id769339]MCR1793659.1 hypothetical protein [Leptospira sp. id769339]
MRSMYYKILIVILFLQSCIGMRYGFETYYRHKDIENFQNTYIKFGFMPKVINENRLNDDLFTYHLFVFFGDTNPLLAFPSAVNPNEGYWSAYYQKPEELPYLIRSDIRFVFLEGCEYRMPTNAGKTFYRFAFGSARTEFSGKLEKEIDLPPNHSIRLSFKEKAIPNPEGKTFSERLENSRSDYDRYEINYTIEQNPSLDPFILFDVKGKLIRSFETIYQYGEQTGNTCGGSL